MLGVASGAASPLAAECSALQGASGPGCRMGGRSAVWKAQRALGAPGVRGEGGLFSMLSGGGCLGALPMRPVLPGARGFPSPGRSPPTPQDATARDTLPQCPSPACVGLITCSTCLPAVSARSEAAPLHLLRPPPALPGAAPWVGSRETPLVRGKCRGRLRGRSASLPPALVLIAAGVERFANATSWC